MGNIFDKPTLTVNLAEQWLAPWAKDNLFIPKKYKYRNSNDYLRFEDAIKLGIKRLIFFKNINSSQN